MKKDNYKVEFFGRRKSDVVGFGGVKLLSYSSI